MKVLFICTGNTCRSPMAEGYFNHLIRQSKTPFLTCASTGVYADAGSPPSPQTAKVMAQMNIDISGHESTPLTRELADSADLIVTMTQSHKLTIANLYPNLMSKTKTLSQFNDKDTYRDIADPFGGDVEVYRQCFEEMKPPLENLFLDLLSHLKKSSE